MVLGAQADLISENGATITENSPEVHAHSWIIFSLQQQFFPSNMTSSRGGLKKVFIAQADGSDFLP